MFVQKYKNIAKQFESLDMCVLCRKTVIGGNLYLNNKGRKGGSFYHQEKFYQFVKH